MSTSIIPADRCYLPRDAFIKTGEISDVDVPRLFAHPWWRPIETAPVPPRDVLKFDRWPCLLQDKHGTVVGGYAAYVRDRLGHNPDRKHAKRPPTYRIQWYAGHGHATDRVFKPVKWMPFPQPEIDT